MSGYEIYLLIGTFFGALSLMSFASVVLDQGSIRIFLVVAVVTGASLYMADSVSDDGVKRQDIAPAIAKLIKAIGG